MYRKEILDFLREVASSEEKYVCYPVDPEFRAIRTECEDLGLIWISEEGGGFDYAEGYTLTPRGCTALGLPVPVKASILQRLVAAVRRAVRTASAH